MAKHPAIPQLWITFILLLTLRGLFMYSEPGVISAILFSKLNMSMANFAASGLGAPNNWAESFMKVWYAWGSKYFSVCFVST